MTDYTDAPFYAISGIGYGKGFTADEAVENYYKIQARNFAHLHRTIKGRIKQIAEAAPPHVWKAPEQATGFVLDSSVWWTGQGFTQRATQEQLVAESVQPA